MVRLHSSRRSGTRPPCQRGRGTGQCAVLLPSPCGNGPAKVRVRGMRCGIRPGGKRTLGGIRTSFASSTCGWMVRPRKEQAPGELDEQAARRVDELMLPGKAGVLMNLHRISPPGTLLRNLGMTRSRIDSQSNSIWNVTLAGCTRQSRSRVLTPGSRTTGRSAGSASQDPMAPGEESRAHGPERSS